MVAVALPALSTEFGASPSSVTLSVVTGYLGGAMASALAGAGATVCVMGRSEERGLGKLRRTLVAVIARSTATKQSRESPGATAQCASR